LGITRVTDITRLDRIGIPVFAGIRPYAAPQTLCVHAGKGVRPEEAKIGAYMESIEFAVADYRRHMHRVQRKTVKEILESFRGDITFPMFCLRWMETVSESDTVLCVEGIEYFSGAKVWVPAELVLHPFVHEGHRSLFDGNTNGLCSGNSLLEAVIHGICEVLERDVKSFGLIDDRSRLVSLETAPKVIKDLEAAIRSAGLQLVVRESPNAYGLPFVAAYVLEPNDTDAIAIADGFGLHPIAEVAAIRAIAEAAQSRLTHIHGGRDDIAERVEFFRARGRAKEIAANENMRKKVADATKLCAFQQINDYSASIHSLDDAITILRDAMGREGLKCCVAVVLSEDEFPFTVARVLIPGAEFLDPPRRRVGPRLLREFQRLRVTSGDTFPSEQPNR
jgi:ribosomal protein S12 methylthiotransferase accessory factor